jgi:hypothetical protein
MKILLLFFSFFFIKKHHTPLVKNQTWVCLAENGLTTKEGITDYIVFYPPDSAVDGMYYGHFASLDGSIAYVKAPITLIGKPAPAVYFKVTDYTYFNRAVTPFDTAHRNDDIAKRLSLGCHYFRGNIADNTMILERYPCYGGSAFTRMRFDRYMAD